MGGTLQLGAPMSTTFDVKTTIQRHTGPTKELWRSKRQIAANRGKSRQIPFRKQWRSLFFKIATDRIAEVRPKKNGDHSGGEILAYFGVHHFCGRMTIFFFNSRYRGGGGGGGSWAVSHQAPIKFSMKLL